jgi:hypothetical protein
VRVLHPWLVLRRPSPFIPKDLRSRLESARLDTLALLRALDHAPVLPSDLPQPQTHQLFELDADCAEALWGLDQPTSSLDVKAMVQDTLASLDQLPAAREQVRHRLPPTVRLRVLKLEQIIRASLDRSEAYDQIPGRDPDTR